MSDLPLVHQTDCYQHLIELVLDGSEQRGHGGSKCRLSALCYCAWYVNSCDGAHVSTRQSCDGLLDGSAQQRSEDADVLPNKLRSIVEALRM